MRLLDDRKYLWRKLNQEQRKQLLTWRRQEGRPWHSPPRSSDSAGQFHLTAACFEHVPIIGSSAARMDSLTQELLVILDSYASETFAWCVLPNHYHALIETPALDTLVLHLGRLHGRSSYLWNGEDHRRGRRCFYRAADRAIRSEGHFYATLNYIHHNAVHHGYVDDWNQWSWSSAPEYLKNVGRAEAERIWREYPILDYGKGWDDRDL